MHIFFVSFRGQKTLEPRTDQSPLAVLISKFPTSIPTLSHAQSPPPQAKHLLAKNKPSTLWKKGNVIAAC